MPLALAMSQRPCMDNTANLDAADARTVLHHRSPARSRDVVQLSVSLFWGPVVFIQQGWPLTFAVAVAAEATALALLCGALPGGTGVGLLLLLLLRSAAAISGAPVKPPSSAEVTAAMIALGIYALIIARVLTPHADGFWFEFPKNLGIAPAAARLIDGALDWLALTFAPAFTGITYLARFTLQAITDLLAWIPWPVFLVASAAAGWWAGGVRTA